MKKAFNIFALFVAVILLCGVTVSCSKEEGNEEKKEEKVDSVQKTIFVFCPYADNLTRDGYLRTDLVEIRNAISASGSMNGYRVLVYYGEKMYSSLIYEVKLRQDNEVVMDTLQHFTNVNQSDEEFLTSIFNTVKTIAPAKTYTMIIGGHGNGWLPSSIYWGDISSAKASSQKKSFGGISSTNMAIEPSVFSSAMTAARFHTDLMIFDCCYMDNIETLYDIRSNTDYVISLPAEQTGDGFWYIGIWGDIIASMNKDVLQDICTQTLYYYDVNNSNYYTESSPFDYVNPVTLGVIDCSELDNLAATMADINLKYPEITTDITDKIQRFDQKAVGIYFDLLDYVKYRVGGDETNVDYLKVKNDLNSAVITTACKGYYFVIIDEDAANSFPVSTFCGIATSDPSVNTSVIELKKNTNWWKATH